jgi:hypothetical protein
MELACGLLKEEKKRNVCSQLVRLAAVLDMARHTLQNYVPKSELPAPASAPVDKAGTGMNSAIRSYRYTVTL